MLLFFVINVLCLNIKVPKVINLKTNEELQIFEGENGKLRIKINKDKTFKEGDKNVVYFEPNDDLFLIKISSGKYLFKSRGEDVELTEIKTGPLSNFDPLQGFKWDIKETENGYKIETDGSCLEKGESTGNENEFNLKAKDCSDTPNQYFNVIDIQSTNEAVEENLDNEYIQEEGPTINPTIHGVNNKRDPYMYGNEPFRGRYHKL